MAYSLFRFIRSIRSMCAPLTAFIGFSFLLTFIFVLYQPSHGPEAKQRLGWQSWEIVSMSDKVGAGQSELETKPPTTIPGNSTTVDWWNVTQEETKVDSSSLPLDVWAPLLPHDTGLSEITIVRCYVNPHLALCDPPTTSEQDAIKGRWVRVDRDLNLQAGVWHLSIYYRRTRRQDINLITDIQLLPTDKSPVAETDPDFKNWKKVDRSVRDGVLRTQPIFLWYRVGKTARDLTPEERQRDVITELDVLFGDDRPWYGFEKVSPPTLDKIPGRMESVHLTYRKGVKLTPKAPPLHFSKEGNFKIMQVADLHFSVSEGRCQETLLPCTGGSDNLTQTLIGRALDAEKPNLVVFSGDQLNGQGTSWDPKSVLAKFARTVTDRGIPWAAVFGNHDVDDGSLRADQMKLMQGLPYSLVEPGPEDVHGVGNYVLKVFSADASKTQLLTLYFLDSGSYSKGYVDWFGFFSPTAYDYLRQSQIDWFLQESSTMPAIDRPFHPDTGSDLGSLWTRQQIPPQTRKLAKPNAMMFFHMPLQEAGHKPDVDQRTGKPLNVGSDNGETLGAAKTNEGFFEKGLMKAMESDHVSSEKIREVKVVGNGHSHLHDNCRRIQGIWSCFGGGGSYSGYGKIGFDRRFRIYDISEYGETIRTYKWTEKDEIVDDMVLVGRGAPPLRR